MNIFKKLFGTPDKPVANPTMQKAVSFGDQLQAAVLKDIPGDWTVFRSKQLLLEIPYPASWTLAEQKDSIIIRPSGSRTLPEGGNLMFSPGFTFMAGGGAKFSDDGLLDAYLANIGQGFQSFRSRESAKLTLNGVRTLALFFDFVRASGSWSCLLTIRAKGSSFWYLDVSGQTDDIASLRPQLVPVLANLRLHSSAADFETAARRTYAPPVEDSLPEGNSIGVLFEIEKCSDCSYGRVFERDFFGRLDMQRLIGTQVFVGDILPECRYYCIRVDGPTPVIRYIRDVFSKVTDIDALPPGAYRFMSGSNLQRAPLVPKQIRIDQAGRIV